MRQQFWQRPWWLRLLLLQTMMFLLDMVVVNKMQTITGMGTDTGMDTGMDTDTDMDMDMDTDTGMDTDTDTDTDMDMDMDTDMGMDTGMMAGQKRLLPCLHAPD